jgi:hypothetical protein
VSLDDLPAKSLDEMMAGMETVKIAPPKNADSKSAGPKSTGKDGHAQIPRIAQAFVTLPERFNFSIDYAPDKIVHCVAPQDPMS